MFPIEPSHPLRMLLPMGETPARTISPADCCLFVAGLSINRVLRPDRMWGAHGRPH